ncbi:tyrosine-type recombinase/integrase [Nocardiopsis quinghaiensis]|uniref:tyrosine-type recombinase/integrase n=1 Tax=Nocardiopsis quinghaiensis TaxID=464995 RepID=UPI00168030EE|nr:site-specific integrase [Nocardiopsis quinghaiensis]
MLTPDGLQTGRTFQTERDAVAWLGEQRSMISKGTWTTATAQLATTFGDYAERWMATRTVRGRPLADRTRATYQDLLDRFILPEFAPTHLHTITREDVKRWHGRRLPQDRPTTRAKAYSLLRAILAGSVDDGYLSANPARIRGAGQVRRRHTIRPASVEELAALTGSMPPRYRLMVALASFCALRYGELTELRRGDVDVKAGVLHVSRAVVLVEGRFVVKTPKSDAGDRDVAIPPHLLPMVRAHLLEHTAPGADGLLFPARTDPSGHLRQSSFAKVYYPARAKAGRPDLRFHDLRHTGATLAAQSGATLRELMSRLGHSSSQAAMNYQHAAGDRDAAIALRLSEMTGWTEGLDATTGE